MPSSGSNLSYSVIVFYFLHFYEIYAGTRSCHVYLSTKQKTHFGSRQRLITGESDRLERGRRYQVSHNGYLYFTCVEGYEWPQHVRLATNMTLTVASKCIDGQLQVPTSCVRKFPMWVIAIIGAIVGFFGVVLFGVLFYKRCKRKNSMESTSSIVGPPGFKELMEKKALEGKRSSLDTTIAEGTTSSLSSSSEHSLSSGQSSHSLTPDSSKPSLLSNASAQTLAPKVSGQALDSKSGEKGEKQETKKEDDAKNRHW